MTAELTADLASFAAACGLPQSAQVVVDQFGAAAPDVHRLARPFLLIGRAADCGLRLPHPDVSFRHAYLQVLGGRVMCIDLASRTGTRRKSDNNVCDWVEPGEDIGIGPYTISYQPEHDESPPTSAEAFRGAPPAAALEFLNGRGSSEQFRRWPLRRELTLIGTSRACKIQLRHDSVSKMHSSLVLTPGGLWVIDLLGRNGTRVNGRPVVFAPLRDGDELQVGRFRMRARLEIATDERPAERPERRRTGVRNSGVRGSRPAAENGLNVSSAGAAARTDGPPGSVEMGSPAEPDCEANRARGFSETFILALVDQFAAMQQQLLAQNQQQTMMLLQVFGAMHQGQQELIREDLQRLHQINRELQQLQTDVLRGRTVERLTAERTGRADETTVRPPHTDAPGPPEVGCRSGANGKASLEAFDRIGQDESAPASAAAFSPADDLPPESISADRPTGAPAERPEGGNDGLPPAFEEIRDVPFSKDSGSDPGPAGACSETRAHAWLAERMRVLEREREGRWQKIVGVLAGGKS